MPDPRLNIPHRFPGFDRRRTGHAANPLPGCLRGVAQVRIRLGKQFAFHGCIIADRTLAEPEPGATIRIVRPEVARQEERAE